MVQQAAEVSLSKHYVENVSLNKTNPRTENKLTAVLRWAKGSLGSMGVNNMFSNNAKVTVFD